MRVVLAVVLGAIQGATEFLPISSSGHLVIFQTIFQFPYSLNFDLALHLATALAALVYFWKDVEFLVAAFFCGITKPIESFKRHPKFRVSIYIIIGSLPAAVMGFAFSDFFESLFSSLFTAGIFLIITGTIILWAENFGIPKKNERQMNIWDALIIGCAQAAAIIPGLSRSGTTVSSALLRGVRRETAARFSFLLSLPVIFGASFYEIIKSVNETIPVTGMEIVFGSIAAFISGYFAIRFFIRKIKRSSIKGFAYYCLVLGVTVVLLYTWTSFK